MQDPRHEAPLADELIDLTSRRRILSAPPPPLPAFTRIIAMSNQKGGVGKTTTTVNMAAALARFGARVLVIDLDPQGNATTALGFNHHEQPVGMFQVLTGEQPLSAIVRKSPEPGELFCAISTLDLAGAEMAIATEKDSRFRLHQALAEHLASPGGSYHYIFIDCPPSLGLLTVNAMVAAHEIFVPIQCEYYALEGLTQLRQTVDQVNQVLNPRLHISTMLLTMFDSRTRLAQDVVDDVRTHFPDIVLNSIIPRTVRVAEAPSHLQSVISYDTNSPGSISYLEAAYEFASRKSHM